MVLTNSTTEIINFTKDIDFEYNIKLFILGILFIYSVALLWFSYKWKPEELYQKLFKMLVLQIPQAVYLIFFPLMTIYLFRSVSWESIYLPLVVFFTYVLTVVLITIPLGSGTIMLQVLGVETKTKKMELKKK